MSTIQNVISELAYIQFPEGLDDEQFADWNQHYGYGDPHLYVTNGIVVEKTMEKMFVSLIEKARKFFQDEE